jgi:glycosyltransferase involved in cell wall biosynthesis
MIGSQPRPLFSVVIPTRNRADLFAVALRSVMEQRFRQFEVIVVDDGSVEPHVSRYGSLVREASPPVQVLQLMSTRRGHGPAYATNYGAGHAQGDYLCFLDDDDQWVDPEHLARAAGVIAVAAEQPDLILSNQHAYRDGVLVERVVWIEALTDRVIGKPDPAGAYAVKPEELLTCPAHCHLNTTIVRRDFFAEIGGFDPELRYEQDRDFYLRAIDRAQSIKYLPCVVSRHNIPDPAAKASVSTEESALSKRLYQLRVLDKAVLFSRRPALRRYAMHHRAYALANIAAEARQAGQTDCAAYYRREALVARLSIAWRGTFGRGR